MIISYKIFSNVMGVRQNRTYIKINNPDIGMYDKIEETLKERFNEYSIKINHVGRTLTINYSSGDLLK